MPVEGGFQSVEGPDGLTVSSNTESAQEIRSVMGLDTPAEAPSEDLEVEQLGADGKTRDASGKFKAKPIPPEKQAKKPEVEAKAEEEKPSQTEKEPSQEEKPEPKQAKAEEKAEPEPEEKPERKSRANERIRELVEERNQLRDALAQIARERAKEPEPQETKAPEPWREPDDPSDPRPKEDNFDNYADFVEARARWASRQEYKQVEQQREVQRRAAVVQKSIESALDRYKQAIDAVGGPSFIESMPEELQNLRPSFVLGPGEQPGPLNALADEILASSDSTRMMRYLAEHPDVLRRFSTPSLTRKQFEREMGKIEAALDSATAGKSEVKAPPFVPRANGPVRPATGSPTAADTDLDPETADFDTWLKVKNAEERKRLGR